MYYYTDIHVLKLVHESQVWLIIRYFYYKTAGYLRTQRNCVFATNYDLV